MDRVFTFSWVSLSLICACLDIGAKYLALNSMSNGVLLRI